MRIQVLADAEVDDIDRDRCSSTCENYDSSGFCFLFDEDLEGSMRCDQCRDGEIPQ